MGELSSNENAKKCLRQIDHHRRWLQYIFYKQNFKKKKKNNNNNDKNNKSNDVNKRLYELSKK